MTDADRSFVIRLFAIVLAIAVLAMISTMLIGLFTPNVDNEKIFGILGPSYQMIIGCAVGLLGGSARSSRNTDPKLSPEKEKP